MLRLDLETQVLLWITSESALTSVLLWSIPKNYKNIVFLSYIIEWQAQETHYFYRFMVELVRKKSTIIPKNTDNYGAIDGLFCLFKVGG